jgi:hypothetical protein
LPLLSEDACRPRGAVDPEPTLPQSSQVEERRGATAEAASCSLPALGSFSDHVFDRVPGRVTVRGMMRRPRRVEASDYVASPADHGTSLTGWNASSADPYPGP